MPGSNCLVAVLDVLSSALLPVPFLDDTVLDDMVTKCNRLLPEGNISGDLWNSLPGSPVIESKLFKRKKSIPSYNFQIFRDIVIDKFQKVC